MIEWCQSRNSEGNGLTVRFFWRIPKRFNSPPVSIWSFAEDDQKNFIKPRSVIGQLVVLHWRGPSRQKTGAIDFSILAAKLCPHGMAPKLRILAGRALMQSYDARRMSRR